MSATSALRSKYPSEEASGELRSIVKETIDGSLRDLLGEDGKTAALFHLQVPDYESNPKEFHVHLGGVFNRGAPVIERMIVRDVYKRLNMRFDEEANFDYESAMRFAFDVCSRLRPSLQQGGGGPHAQR